MASLLDSSSESDEEVVLKPLSKREVQLSTGNSQPRMELRLNYHIPYFFTLSWIYFVGELPYLTDMINEL